MSAGLFCPVSARYCGSKPNHIAGEKFDNESVDDVFGIVINYHAQCSLSWSRILLIASALNLLAGRSKRWATPLPPNCDARDRVFNGNRILHIGSGCAAGRQPASLFVPTGPLDPKLPPLHARPQAAAVRRKPTLHTASSGAMDRLTPPGARPNIPPVGSPTA